MEQASLLDSPDVWTSDDWETPDWLAEKMAGLIQPEECRILEPSAGTGQVCRAIVKTQRWDTVARSILAVEPRPDRSDQLFRLQIPLHLSVENYCTTLEKFFFEWRETDQTPFDLVITNPPFSLGMDFLEISMQLITPTGRVLFLLPSDYFQAKSRAERLSQIDCFVTRVWPIVGRVAYLKNGVPCRNRQCYDSVFEFRPGGGPGIDFIHQ